MIHGVVDGFEELVAERRIKLQCPKGVGEPNPAGAAVVVALLACLSDECFSLVAGRQVDHVA